MAFIQTEIKIPSLDRTIPTSLYFPTDLPAIVGNEVKGVITLLHGYTNTGTDWMMMTSAPRYAADNGYILIAPGADNSFYHDMYYGTRFFTAITQELPDQLRSIYKIPEEREKNYIAGLSMGGYGALRIGLSFPERYAAIGSFSGSMDIVSIVRASADNPYERAIFSSIFGEDLQVPEEANPFHLIKKVATLPENRRPRIFCTCGIQDADNFGNIRGQNDTFRQAVRQLPLDYLYREWDGVHEFNFWDRSLAEFIGFIQNSDYGQRKCADWSALATDK